MLCCIKEVAEESLDSHFIISKLIENFEKKGGGDTDQQL